MEYTSIWQPLTVIWVSFGTGLLLGSLGMFYRIHRENEALRDSREVLRKKLDKLAKNNIDQYNGKTRSGGLQR
jgi:hypothetical protein